MKANYNLYDNYNLDYLQTEAMEILSGHGIDDPTDTELWDVIYHLDSLERKAAYDELRNVFNGKFLAVGTCGRWNGTFAGGFIFETFDELMARFSNCDYIKLWMENGHFYVKGSHHDGIDEVEVKRITGKGEIYYANWDYGPVTDKRTEREVHAKMFADSHYTHLIKLED